MSTTVHKVIIHDHIIIIEDALLPIGMLSEEVLYGRNKDFKYFHEHFSRKTSRIDTLRDVYNRLFLSSDPSISMIRPNCNKRRKSLDEAALQLLK